MADMTAAHAARIEAALDKPFITDTLNTTFREAIADGTIAYGRIRTFSTGKRTYGVILTSDVADQSDKALEYVSYYDAPKSVVGICSIIVHA